MGKRWKYEVRDKDMGLLISFELHQYAEPKNVMTINSKRYSLKVIPIEIPAIYD